MSEETTPTPNTDGAAIEEHAATESVPATEVTPDATPEGDAPQEGLSEQVTIADEVKELGFADERSAKLEQISERSRDDDEFVDRSPKQPPLEVEEVVEPEPAPESTPAVIQEPTVTDGDKPHTLKVFGEEKQYSDDELRQMASKAAGADQKFMEAAQKEKDIERRERELAQREAAISTHVPAPADQGAVATASNATTQATEKPVGETVDIVELQSKAILEDDEDAKRQLNEHYSKPVNPSVDVDSIANAVLSKQQEQQRVEQQQAWETSVTAANNAAATNPEYADIYADQDLVDLADRKTVQLMTAEPGQTASYYINTAMDHVKSKFIDGAQQQPDTLSSRTAAKENHAAHAMGSRQSATASAPQQQEVVTAETAIAEMRKHREI